MTEPNHDAAAAEDHQAMAAAADASAQPEAIPESVYRHKLPVRLWHWLNVIAMTGLFMSGLMIFNAHPHLYWGDHGAQPDTPWLTVTHTDSSGALTIGNVTIPTTGLIGYTYNLNGTPNTHAFPSWITLPGPYDLAGGRHFHLFFAWLFGIGFLLFFLWAIFSRHASRDLTPKLAELKPGHLIHEVVEHAQLKFPTGLAAARFNTLQRISYFVVILIFIPLMILTGLTMSPTMNASWPWLLDIFGGRASARSIHFIICWALFGFVVVHLVMVVLAGAGNEIRSMITGHFRLPPPRGE